LLIIEFVYNNNYYVLIEILSFYLIYNYYLKIYYKVENNFTKKKILLAQKRVKQLYNLKKILAKHFESAVTQQTKYYNKKYKLKSFVVEELIILLTKNLKQKISSKKISHKYIELFRIKNKIEMQTYCFILFNIYRIYNTFYILLLKLYLHCVDNEQTKQILQILKFINNKIQ